MRTLYAIMTGSLLLCSGAAMAQQKPTSFTGELMAGQSYTQALPDKRVFSLTPIVGGWRAAVTDGGSCGNIASITMPPEALNIVLATPAGPGAQPSTQLPAPNNIRYALSCNDYAQFMKANECDPTSKRMCTDMGAVASGRVVLRVTSFVPQRRAYNAPAAYLNIKFNLDMLEPAPSGAN